MAEAKRRLTAILAADVAGYSRLMEADEEATVAALNSCRALFKDKINEHQGRVVDTAGDSVLAEFASVVEAVRSAIEVQLALAEQNDGIAEDRRMLFRIGVNLGDVIAQDDGTLYGDGVNVAARLQGLAEPGGLMVSESAHMQVDGKVVHGFTDAGTHQVKNIARPIKAYAWKNDGTDALEKAPMAGPRDRKPTVAIGSFDAVGNSDDIAVLADGVRDAVVASLSNQTGVTMLSEANKADHVVVARIQALGDRYRAAVQVLDRDIGEHFASNRFDGVISDLFEAQDELAYRIYTWIRLTVIAREGAKVDERPIGEQGSEALLAQAGYIMAGADRSQWTRAREMLEAVVDRNPDDFMALAMISFCCLVEVMCGYREIAPRDCAVALESAHRARRLNEQSDFVHFTISHVHLTCRRDFETAESAARRSLELNPNNTVSMFGLGMVLIFDGRVEEGIELCMTGVDTNPRGPLNHRIMWHIALGHFVLEQYETAIEWSKRSDHQMPDVAPTLLVWTAAAALSGQLEDAQRAAARLMTQNPDFTLDALRQWPFRDPTVWQRFTDGLRTAGLDNSDKAMTTD